MAQITYGSITLVDITDSGQLSVYPTSNMPLSIIYDPDQNTYTPNWSSTNLTLTPVIYYNVREVNLYVKVWKNIVHCICGNIAVFMQ